MSEVCPNCERIVGKLYLSCRYCGVRYCEDCIHPKEHYCPSYREENNKTVPSTKVSLHISSEQACKDFADKNTENEKDVPFLTLREIKKRVSAGLGTLDMYICPRCLNIRDNERYACFHCNTGRTIKCDWCGNHFCEVCIMPESHNCLQYENYLRKLSYIKPNHEFMPKPVTEPILEPITKPEPVAKSTPEPVEAIQINPIEEKSTKSWLDKIRSFFRIL